MDKLDLAVEDLLLDLANPRLGGVASQVDALRGLVGLGPNYFRDLLLSIKENGLDPGDAFYVIPDLEDESAHIVVDGNRRLAALKALIEPAVLTHLKLSDRDQKSLVKAASGFDPKAIETVSCVVFEDRTVADPWIERRHGRDLGGEGRLTWSPLEIERFQKDRSTLDVIDFVERSVGGSHADWATIRKEVEKTSSTLRRFLSSSIGRDWLGYSVLTDEADGGKVPAFARLEAFVAAVLERVFSDIAAHRITSRTHNTTDDIRTYFEGLPQPFHPTGQLLSPATLFREAAGAKAKPAATSAPTTRAKPARSTLAAKRHAFAQPTTIKGQRLVWEASRVRVADFPLASAYILRAFLEHTIDSYMNAHGIPRADGKTLLDLNNRAVKVIDHLVKSGAQTNQSLRGATRVLTNTSDHSSIQALNDYHHDRYQLPAADALRSGWEACVPLFIAVYGAAK